MLWLPSYPITFLKSALNVFDCCNICSGTCVEVAGPVAVCCITSAVCTSQAQGTVSLFVNINSKELLEVYSLVSVQTSQSFRTLAASPKNQFAEVPNWYKFLQ